MQKKEGLLSLGYLSLALALTFVGSFGIGSVPPFLAAISPSEGIWRRKIQGEKYQRIPSPFLRKSAQAYYDKSGVVHVFAQTDHDLYWIQGFITARDRLWQMDFQSRVADGRLAELLGKKALGLDEYFVSVGMRQAISLADENLQTDPTTQMPVSAFVSGVNSYVESLEERDYPLEYILTGTKPKKWSSRDIASLLKLMSFRLAGHSDDLVMTRYLQKFGDKILQDLFPYQHDLEVPFARVGGGRQSDPSARVLSEPFIARLQGFPSFLKPRPGNGSNNWALSGKKTKLGFSLLANDTHLSYSLPSIWYEMQLNSPHQSVYGATIPGAPGIILGYNNQIAWATTNASTDVMDWFEMEFRDESSDEYLAGDQWRAPEKIIYETIQIKNEKSINKKVLWSHLGPIVHREGKLGLALRWAVHESSNEVKALLELNQASTFRACLQALTHFKAPAQNFICADSENISIRHNGRIPRRGFGEGRYIQNGRDIQFAGSSWLGEEEIPQEINPSEGFVFSANQKPNDPRDEVYLGWVYPEAFRGKRIKEVLSQAQSFGVADMIKLQNDDLNVFAREALPLLLDKIKVQEQSHTSLGDLEREALTYLKNWNFHDSSDSIASSIFFHWWQELEVLIWKDEFGMQKDELYPSRDRTLKLIRNISVDPHHPDKKWIIGTHSPQAEDFNGREALYEISNKSFSLAVRNLESHWGSQIFDWQWSKVRPMVFPHISYFPGMGGPKGVRMGGSQYTVNANKGNHGPTWRMVVEFRPSPRAWGNYPGGTTGDPLDDKFDQYLESWSKGELRPFLFYGDSRQAENEAQRILSFEPKARTEGEETP